MRDGTQLVQERGDRGALLGARPDDRQDLARQRRVERPEVDLGRRLVVGDLRDQRNTYTLRDERGDDREVVGEADDLGLVAGAIAAAGSGSGMTVAGLSMCVAAAAAWAVANLLMKRATDADPIALMVWISLVPPLPLLVLSMVIDGPGSITTILHLDLKSLAAIAYIAAFSTLGGFAAWSWLMRTYPAAQVASFALLVPPFGLLFAALLLGEPLGPLQIASALLVVSGVAISTGTLHPLRHRPSEPSLASAPSAR